MPPSKDDLEVRATLTVFRKPWDDEQYCWRWEIFSRRVWLWSSVRVPWWRRLLVRWLLGITITYHKPISEPLELLCNATGDENEKAPV